MTWGFGRHRVTFDAPSALADGAGHLVVDHNERVMMAHGVALKLGKTTAVVRFAFDRGRSRPQIWIGETPIPASPDDVRQKRLKGATACAAHGAPGSPYRNAPGVDAAYECARCKLAVCKQCTAVDRIHCRPCFFAALGEEDWHRRAFESRRSLRIGIAIVVTALLAVLGTWGWELWPQLGLAAFGLAFGVGFIAFHASRIVRPRDGSVRWDSSYRPPLLPQWIRAPPRS